MSRKTPPLNSLRVFESVARLRNLTKAASELHVTQPAVSRQIVSLETWLGVRLLRREARGVSLTAAGVEYYREINHAFTLIESASIRAAASDDEGLLRIRVYSTFTAQWLMHRLPAFHARWPQIDVSLDDSLEPVDFDRDNIDIAIEYCKGDRPKATQMLLFRDRIEPVCSPALLRSATPLRTPADLSRYRLLYSRYRKLDWVDWFSAVGLGDQQREKTTVFPSSLLAYRASIAGMGVAMGHIHLLERELESGLLVRPFNFPIQRPDGYYLLLPPDRQEKACTRAFVAWLQSEVGAMRESRRDMETSTVSTTGMEALKHGY